MFFAAAGAIWHSMAGSVKGRAACVALALILVAFLTFNRYNPLIDVRHAKGQTLAKEFFQKWNSFSRIGVAHIDAEDRYDILIDADAATGIANFDFDHLSRNQRTTCLEQGPALPYALRPGAKTLIIGPGGGWDVARALASGSHDITGVEINPIIATTIMRERFPELSHDLYLRPDVHIYVEDGRSFVRRSPDRYQVLQATLVDTWASTAAGAFALSENNLYTTDAFRDYLAHLTDDGMVVFTRWGFDPPRESLRLISLAIEALAQLGENGPWRHVIVGREGSVQGWGAKDTVHRRPQALHPADLARAARWPLSHMQTVYLPGAGIHNHFTDLLHQPRSRRIRARLRLRHLARHRQPAVLLLYRAAARPLVVRQERLPGHRRLQGQQGRAAAVRAHGHQPGRHRAHPRAAAPGAGNAPAAPGAACAASCCTSSSSARATF